MYIWYNLRVLVLFRELDNTNPHFFLKKVIFSNHEILKKDENHPFFEIPDVDHVMHNIFQARHNFSKAEGSTDWGVAQKLRGWHDH